MGKRVVTGAVIVTVALFLWGLIAACLWLAHMISQVLEWLLALAGKGML